MRRMYPRNWFVGAWSLLFAVAVLLLARCLAAGGSHTDSADASASLSFSVRTAIAAQAVRTLLPALTSGDAATAETSPLSSLATLCMLQWEPAAVCAAEASASDTLFSAEKATADAAAAQATETAAETSADVQTAAPSELSENTANTAAEAVTEMPAAEETAETSAANISHEAVTDSQAAKGNADSSAESTADTTVSETGAKLIQTAAGTILQHGAATELAYTEAELADFTFLLNNLYTLDSTTTIDASLLDGSVLLSADMTLAKDASVPQILIYHTHSQETFADSVADDVSTSIVGVGDYLTTLLSDVYGYQVIHDRQTYDLIDGELDRNKAYTLALESVSEILEENPTVQIVIDLHRDGIEGEKMTTTINGKEIARLMFFNGLSRTVKNGALESLANPYIQDNLAFSLQLKLAIERYYPGATRPVYLKGYRYNLHLRPRCLLVEAGSQKNTVQEEMNAMEVLADALDMVLRGEE